MKPLRSLFALGCATLLFTACSHLDMTPPGGPDRVLTGSISAVGVEDNTLPSEAEIEVRVVDLSRGERTRDILAEETFKSPGKFPVPFHLEYRAEDDVLRHQVNVEVRISYGGRLRFISGHAHPITLSNVSDTHTVEVEPVNQQR